MISTADFKNGITIEYNGDIYTIVEFQHVKPGKGGAFMRTKLKNLQSGGVQDRTFRSGEKFKEAIIEKRSKTYLYSADDLYHFMDEETYDQTALSSHEIGEATKYLKENITVEMLIYEDKTIGIDLPTFVNLKVTIADPGVKGNTATGGSKPVTLETGLVVQAPLFVEEGEVIKVDTRDSSYVERVNR